MRRFVPGALRSLDAVPDAMIAALVTMTYALSHALLVFGPAPPDTQARGLFMVLMSLVVLGSVGVALTRRAHIYVTTESTPLVVLAGGTASVAAALANGPPAVAGATIVAGVILTSLAAGLAMTVLGQLRGEAQAAGLAHVPVTMRAHVEALFTEQSGGPEGSIGFTVSPLAAPPAGDYLRQAVPPATDPVWDRFAALGFGRPPQPPLVSNPAYLAWVERVEAVRFAEVSAGVPMGLGTPSVAWIPTVTELAPGQNQAAGNLSWSGAYIRATARDRIASVSGAWTVPKAAPAPLPTVESRTSQWIGLDGYDAGSMSLVQCGTMRSFGEPSGEEHRLWWQWYVRGARWDPPYQIGGIPINAGTRVEASVTILSAPPGAPRRKVLFRFLVSEPAPRDRRPVLLMFKVEMEQPCRIAVPADTGAEGRVAEWIVERPMRYGEVRRNRLYDLPLFEPVTFDGCAARLEQGGSLDNRFAQLLKIVDWDSLRPSPGRALTTARATGPEGFEVIRLGPPKAPSTRR